MGNFNFHTEVAITTSEPQLHYNSQILLMGSCFTTEIGKIMQDYRFNVMVNPMGTLYNPASICSSLERISACRYLTPDEVVLTNPAETGGKAKYASFFHHSSFARETGEEFLHNANRALEESHNYLQQADTLIITLGTAWTFRHLEKGYVVSNCHKRNPKEFQRELLSIEECTTLLESIPQKFPDKNIIFTVSPIRHLKDGAHGNQISKSTLLMSVENIVGKHSRCTYFPSYEIMMDELRDYRFYAEDMLHPSELAVKYIFEKFTQVHISSQVYPQMKENLKKTKSEKHILK